MRILAIVGLGICLSLFAADGSAQVVSHGAPDYKLCASCHGFKGQGNQLVNAPALAGQQDWYLRRQIQNFRAGVRGYKANDTHGNTMALMTKGIDSDEQVADIVAYIGTLPVAELQNTISGDSEKGRIHYAACAACHGPGAEGNAALNAPALRTIDDWYQLRQLQSFKAGDRGVHPDDTYGQQMRPLAVLLPDDDAMRDVVAYINSLR